MKTRLIEKMKSKAISIPTPPRHIPVSGMRVHDCRPAFTRIACPKCGSRSLSLIEEWNTGIGWDVTDGWLDRANGNLDGNGGGGGYPVRVVAHCPCGHQWTVRKARQIDDVVEFPEEG